MSKFKTFLDCQISAAERQLNAGLGACSRILPRVHDLPCLRSLPGINLPGIHLPGIQARDVLRYMGMKLAPTNPKDQEGQLS